MTSKADQEGATAMLRALQLDLDAWYTRTQSELATTHLQINDKIEGIRRAIAYQGTTPARAVPPAATPPRVTASSSTFADSDASSTPLRATPVVSPHPDRLTLDALLGKIAQANNSPPLNVESLYEKLSTEDLPAVTAVPPSRAVPSRSIPLRSLMGMGGQLQTQGVQLSPDGGGRPRVVPIPGGVEDTADSLDVDVASACQVLVEFKRGRVLQFDAAHFVSPGDYVVVGGDRGEDVGLVVYTSCATRRGTVQGVGLTGAALALSIGIGSDKVLRAARPTEVAQLHGILHELERRALEVCAHKALERGLPMVIVDAEYQFDKKKLTFYYEAQQRMDFRELVRDLFKTFRARIWMEAVETQ